MSFSVKEEVTKNQDAKEPSDIMLQNDNCIRTGNAPTNRSQ